MQIDKQSLDRLLSLSDRQLARVIDKLAAENGIDPSSFNINPADIASIRSALSKATDEDISRLAEQLEAFKRQNGGTGK